MTGNTILPTSTIATSATTWAHRGPTPTTMSQLNLNNKLLNKLKTEQQVKHVFVISGIYPQKTTIKVIAITTPYCILSIPRILKLPKKKKKYKVKRGNVRMFYG